MLPEDGPSARDNLAYFGKPAEPEKRNNGRRVWILTGGTPKGGRQMIQGEYGQTGGSRNLVEVALAETGVGVLVRAAGNLKGSLRVLQAILEGWDTDS